MEEKTNKKSVLSGEDSGEKSRKSEAAAKVGVETNELYEQKIADLETKITELTNDLQRTRADFENYRKQAEAQKEHAVESGKEDTVKKFFPLLDDIERAVVNYKELKPLEKNLEKTLRGLNLEKIESKPGTAFDPALFEAIAVEEGEGEKEVVAETLRTGYYYQGEVVRPAMVKVGYQK